MKKRFFALLISLLVILSCVTPAFASNESFKLRFNENGEFVSPVDGEILSIAETKHAYGFCSEDGMEILVHFGLETVALKGEGFTPRVQVGDKVQAGDLVAEVDLEFLKAQNINLITPVIICDGADDMELNVQEGEVKVKDTLILLENAETEKETGKTNELTNVTAKIYEGFNLPNVTQFKINGDGSTILKLYYNSKRW